MCASVYMCVSDLVCPSGSPHVVSSPLPFSVSVEGLGGEGFWELGTGHSPIFLMNPG